MGKNKPRTAEKEAIYQAKQVARRERIAHRNIVQEPIKSHLRALNCPKQEVGSLFRSRCSEILMVYQTPVVVRFCYPNYPDHWIKSQEEAAPFITVVNRACLQNRVKKPVYANNIGGYVLYLMEDESSAQFVRGLLPQLSQATKTNMRVPSRAEIDEFHSRWQERSPKMFSNHVKGGGPCFHNARPKKR